jgi:hypothetical protein
MKENQILEPFEISREKTRFDWLSSFLRDRCKSRSSAECICVKGRRYS